MERNDDVTHSIKAVWIEIEACLRGQCNKKLLPSINGKFNKEVIRPTLWYRPKYWPIKNSHIQKTEVAVMRILRRMCAHRRYRIRSEIT